MKKKKTYKKQGALYRFLHRYIKKFMPDNELIFRTEEPENNEGVVYICNHTKIYAPLYFMSQDVPPRIWVNCYFFTKEMCWGHLKNKVLYGKRKFLRPLGYLLVPLIVRIINCFDFIPVYHQSRELYDVTFAEGVKAAAEGTPQVIFPERTENMVNDYIYELNAGFPLLAKQYYDATGKIMRFYPVYCAQSIHKVVVGEPISFDPSIPIKIQRKQIAVYLQDKIGELGDSLPPHEKVIYG